MTGQILLREVQEADLPALFEHQNDPVANEMAAFPPRDREAFMAHWQKVLADPNVIQRTIVFDGEVAGNVVCFERSGERQIGYWLGRKFWGQGIATRAVREFVSSISIRPLSAHVAKHNRASARVLEKCGFKIFGEDRAAAVTGGEVVDEFVYTLDDR